jgi:hypothetical protein
MNYLKTYQIFEAKTQHAPITVSGNFDCSYNKLTLLDGCPITVLGNFNCSNNDLTSLEHGPTTVTGHFYFDNNKFPVMWQSKKLTNINNKTGLFN